MQKAHPFDVPAKFTVFTKGYFIRGTAKQGVMTPDMDHPYFAPYSVLRHYHLVYSSH